MLYSQKSASYAFRVPDESSLHPQAVSFVLILNHIPICVLSSLICFFHLGFRFEIVYLLPS
jgi:hypothetical protein